MNINDLYQAVININEELFQQQGQKRHYKIPLHLYLVVGSYQELISLNNEYVLWDSENDTLVDTVEDLEAHLRGKLTEYALELGLVTGLIAEEED